VIGYDKASKIAHYAMDNDLTLKAAALKLGLVTEAEFDRIVDPKKTARYFRSTTYAVRQTTFLLDHIIGHRVERQRLVHVIDEVMVGAAPACIVRSGNR